MPKLDVISPIDGTRRILNIIHRMDKKGRSRVLSAITDLINADNLESFKTFKEKAAARILNEPFNTKKKSVKKKASTKRAAPKKKKRRAPRKKKIDDLNL